MKKCELKKAASIVVQGLINAGYAIVSGEYDLYAVKPGRVVIQLVNCGLAGGGVIVHSDSLVVMQGYKVLLKI